MVAILVVFITYNPDGVSFYHWLNNSLPNVEPLLMFIGVAILIGWTILLRATLRSLGAFGLMLAIGFFGTLLWVLVDFDVIPANSERSVTYIALIMLASVLATGVSWSHVRRSISGQGDVDEVDH